MAIFQLFHHDDNHTIGIVGNMTVQVWRGKETLMNYMQELLPINQWMAQKYSKGYLSLMLIESTCSLPSQERIKEAAKIWKLSDHALKGLAMVVDGEGFRAAAVRGATTAINLLASPKSPMQIFSQSDQAFAWLTTMGRTLEDNVPPEQMAEVLKTARKQQPGLQLTRLPLAVS